jgi:hypothetical protein
MAATTSGEETGRDGSHFRHWPGYYRAPLVQARPRQDRRPPGLWPGRPGAAPSAPIAEIPRRSAVTGGWMSSQRVESSRATTGKGRRHLDAHLLGYRQARNRDRVVVVKDRGRWPRIEQQLPRRLGAVLAVVVGFRRDCLNARPPAPPAGSPRSGASCASTVRYRPPSRFSCNQVPPGDP